MWRSGKNLFLAHWSICVSFAQVKSHIHTYLKKLEENLLDIEDRTELYLLFVNCFQVKQTDSPSPLVLFALQFSPRLFIFVY